MTLEKVKSDVVNCIESVERGHLNAPAAINIIMRSVELLHIESMAALKQYDKHQTDELLFVKIHDIGEMIDKEIKESKK